MGESTTTVIKEGDTVKDMVVKMMEGNPGGMSVMMAMITPGVADVIDPDCPDPILLLCSMDLMELRGHLIWGLFKYSCDKDITRTLAAIRATQLGLITKEQLHKSIEAEESLDLIELVQTELPNFGRNKPGVKEAAG